MSRNTRIIAATPEEVFAILADGWLYPSWVVGATRMRQVDPTWPAAGAQLYHSFGAWPLMLNDETRVEWIDAPHTVLLRAKGWPMGEVRVLLEVSPREGGSAVRLREWPVRGPGKLVPPFLMRPALHLRNRETLRRLAFLAERRAG